MKIAISSSGKDISSDIDPRFGRCKYFLIVDTETMDFKAIPNSAAGAAHGAGIQASQLVASNGAKIVLTGNVGPNAHSALTASSVEVVTGVSGTVREAVESFKQGELQPTSEPTVRGHFGSGRRGGGRGQGRRR